MQQVWQELKEGWGEASWSGYFILALFPLLMIVSLLTALVEGGVSMPPGPLFWFLGIGATLVSLYWAGLKSGLNNWLGRTVFVLTLILLVIMLIRHMARTNARQMEVTRRIGHYEVTIPIRKISEDVPEVVRQTAPWWLDFRTAFESLSHCTWSA
jgi:hypothetical protein